jgi:hypothetical protein
LGRVEQIAKNELVFRRLNDEIEQLSERWRHEVMDAFCECGDPDCLDHLPVRLAQYQDVRDNRHFLVRPGHEIADVEKVVERYPDFVVVEKPDDARRIATRAADA